MKRDRIKIRACKSERKQFEEAACRCGMNLSEFLRRSALDKSFEIIRKNNSIILSNEDRDAFLNALNNPPEPNKKLKQAIKHHKRLVKNGCLCCY
jgi:uncharacterized protein (DUF1778 family)